MEEFLSEKNLAETPTTNEHLNHGDCTTSAENVQPSNDDFDKIPTCDLRGISVDTYRRYGCSYDISERRIVIPTVLPDGNSSYVKVLTNSKRQELKDAGLVEGKDFKKVIAGKGTRGIFNLNGISADSPVFITEGELDALSIAHCGYSNVIAVGGQSTGNLIEWLNNNPAEYQFLILFDNDKAGRNAAPKATDDLKRAGYRTAYDFLSTKNKKEDANDILMQKGETSLRTRINLIGSKANFNLDVEKVKEEYPIAEYQPVSDINVIQDLLNHIPCAELTYTEWLSVGMTLKSLGCSVDIWDKWSQNDTRYKAAEINAKWNSFNAEKGEWSIATLIFFAKKFGYSGTALLFFNGDDTDLDNARRIAYVFRDKLRYMTDTDSWATFDGAKWIVGEDSKISSIYPFISELADTMKTTAKSEKERKLAKTFASMKKINPAIAFMKGVKEIFITRKDLDQHKNLLNCLNGVVDLESKKFYPHSPDLLLTQQINAAYKPNLRSDIVDNFFNTILPDADTRAAFLRFLGYGLTGEINEEKALFIFGDGGNGKGTLTQTLLRLIGTYATPFPIKAILQRYQTKDCNAATPAFSQLECKRLAIAEEIPKGERLDIAQFKSLTGGDQLPVRRLHHELSIIEDPTHKMIFSGNHLPELDDARDFGLIRRLLVINFTQTFDASNCDVYLKQKLLMPDALSSLLSLLIDNAAQWYKNGLLNSDAMIQTKNEYLKREDFVAEFIDENCVQVATGVIPLKDFLNRLRDSSATARHMTDRALRDTVSRTLAAMQNVEKKRRNQGTIIFGLGWIVDDTDPFANDFTGGESIPDSATPF